MPRHGQDHQKFQSGQLAGKKGPIEENQHVNALIGTDYISLYRSIAEVRRGDQESIARMTPLGWTCVVALETENPIKHQTSFATTCQLGSPAKEIFGCNLKQKQQSAFGGTYLCCAGNFEEVLHWFWQMGCSWEKTSEEISTKEMSQFRQNLRFYILQPVLWPIRKIKTYRTLTLKTFRCVGVGFC